MSSESKNLILDVSIEAACRELRFYGGKVHWTLPSVDTGVSDRDLIILPQWTPADLLKIARRTGAQVAILAGDDHEIENTSLLGMVDWVWPRETTQEKIHAALAQFPQTQSFGGTAPAANAGTAPALFLDRDGVVNVDHGYVGKADEVQLVPRVAAFIARANHRHFKTVIITNQSGIGRGFYGVADFQQVMKRIQTQLQQEGAHFDDFDFSPFHPQSAEVEFRSGRQFRKPRPGMIHRASCRNGIAIGKSVFVGDRAKDLISAVLAGVERAYLLESDQSVAEWKEYQDWISKLRRDLSLVQEEQFLLQTQVSLATDFSEIHL